MLSAYLEKQGVPLDTLKEVVEEKQIAAETQSWSDATEKFLAQSDWPGGQENLQILGEYLQANDLMTARDKVGVLTAAYKHLREQNLLVENREVSYQQEMATARSAEDVRVVNHKFFGTSLFNM